MTPPTGRFVCWDHAAAPSTALEMDDESSTSQTKNLADEPSSAARSLPSSFMSRMATLAPCLMRSSTQARPRPEALLVKSDVSQLRVQEGTCRNRRER